MSKISFTVFGNPVGKQRPKFGRGRVYTPDKTVGWETSVWGQALNHRPKKLWDGPLRIRLLFVLYRGKSISKKRKYPATKPDLDNMEKAVLDALEKVVYTNDSRIVSKVIDKVYGDPPRVEIEVEEL